MTDIDWEDVREDLGVARKIPAPPANVAPRPAVSQSTAIEQSRAVAEVQAAIFIAQQFPRNEATALARVRAACGQRTIAEKAFYRYPRSDKTVTGETIHLARELVRCWGHVDFGIRELARDEQRGESEMLAYAWDLEVNTRVTNTFIAPHRRDRKEGARPLVDLREVYENNANLGARRLRECIWGILPGYVIEEAKRACLAALEGDGTKPLPQRIADCIATFDGIGIIVDQLEAKVDRRSQRWTALDVAQLGVVFRALQRGEVTREEEFPPARVTAAEILTQAPPVEPVPVLESGDDIWPPVPPVETEEGEGR